MKKIATISMMASLILILALNQAAYCRDFDFSESYVKVSSPDYYNDSLEQSITTNLVIFEDLSAEIRFSERENSDKVGFTGIDKAYVKLKKSLPSNGGRLALSLGLDSPNWSLWNGNSIALSGTSPGYMQASLEYKKDSVSYDKLLGKLSGDDRFLIGHRLSLSYGNLTGSIGEVAVVDGATTGDLTSLLPWPVYLTQWIRLMTGSVKNNKINDAIVLQGIYRGPGQGGILAGAELFIDDAPYINRKQPFEGGGQIRLELPLGVENKLGRLNTQYVRINNYAYSYLTRESEFSQNGFSLGAPGGPDHDEIRVEYMLPKALLTIDTIGLVQIRRGQGRLGDYWENIGRDYGFEHQFLSGVVATTRALYGMGSYQLWDGCSIEYRLGGGPVNNLGNKAGNNTIRPYLAVGIRYTR